MSILDKIGMALRDGVYEIFMEYAKVTDLKELREKGFSVKELPLSPDPATMDKLYILTKGTFIICSCTLTVVLGEPVVRFLNNLETFEAIQRIKAAGRESRSAVTKL